MRNDESIRGGVAVLLAERGFCFDAQHAPAALAAEREQGGAAAPSPLAGRFSLAMLVLALLWVAALVVLAPPRAPSTAGARAAAVDVSCIVLAAADRAFDDDWAAPAA